LRQALAAEGIGSELRDVDAIVAVETTAEAVGLAAFAAGVVIYEMRSERFDLEEIFLELTAAEGGTGR
jgi:ABC-type anion transport system duplicated permease subunit